jgi:outer membrane protein OmpA-like peptidoglycan-associated protein
MTKLRFLLVIIALVVSCSTIQAQFGKRLGKTIEDAAKRTVERKADQKTEEAVGKGIDKATDPNTYKDKDKDKEKEKSKDKKSSKKQTDDDDADDAGGDDDVETSESGSSKATGVKADEMAWNKFDFVSGDEVIFDDQFVGETQGEFPSQWDLLGGNAEIAKINGQTVLACFEDAHITPLMKTPKNYLPDVYTIEFDFYVPQEIGGYWKFYLKQADSDDDIITFEWWTEASNERAIETRWKTTSNERRAADGKADLSKTGWHRLSLSFNKRALKIYVDQERVINVPNVAQAGWFTGYAHTSEKTGYFLRDVRIAKGAVPLYDRMMSDGKFITYGITFDVGKSTIKPESMGEINRIVKLMTDNPELKFSVEGHTDATGNAASNQTLSEARSKAVVDKLVEMGVAADRLQAAGKGQSSPLADNATDEGRAKNRRVEFVKI